MKAIIVSASSGIGGALAQAWRNKGWEVHGTYRRGSSAEGWIHCDLSSTASIQEACALLKQNCPIWDVLVFAAGVMDPIGPFEHLPFDAWEEGVQVNCLRQLRVLHELLPYRRRNANRPSVLFFAAGGTNGPAVNYSGYTISKIMLLKMCEFLDAEIPDTRFVIVGPGWVKTKIHESTLRAGSNAGGNWQRTQERLAGGEWVSMDQVVDCCTWLVSTDSKGVDGRNFSVAHDAYGSKVLERALEQNPDMYKLRRYNNSWRASGGSYPTN